MRELKIWRMKINIIIILFLFVPVLAYSQDWQQGTQGIYYNNGKVGIGVSPQNGTFTVNDPGVSQLRIENDTPGGEPTIRLRARTSNNSAWLHADIGIYSSSNSPETGFLGFKVPYNNTYGVGYKMIINSFGNVGIGTTSPGQKLTVQGVVRSQLSSSNYVNNFFVSGDGNCYMNYAGGSSSSRVGFQIDGSSKASIYKNGNFVVHSGNLGIGYNDPQYKLSVNGVISATEVKVSTTPNSDYVFEPDYALKPLQEVDQFIQQNKHLPDIPSAAEFKENGVGLGEMDNMLLQKIEELTLYVIELKKENEELKADNIAIKDGLLKELETIKAQLR
jgi:hypothetical protein